MHVCVCVCVHMCMIVWLGIPYCGIFPNWFLESSVENAFSGMVGPTLDFRQPGTKPTLLPSMSCASLIGNVHYVPMLIGSSLKDY